MPQLLLELLSEEIPARMQAQAARDLERLARERLAAEGLLPEALITFAGSRRLTLVAEGLPPAQKDRHEEVKGPRTTAPEQALDGFLRKNGLTKDQLVEKDGVWFATLHKHGRPTPAIVAEMVDAIVRDFPWPKSMVSGVSKLRWVRPLRRILCVFDGEIVPFSIDGIDSGDTTEGHRFMGPGQPFTARSFEAYADGLARHCVVLDPGERKQRIVEAAKTLCFARNLELVEDQGLLDEVAGLVEWPVPVLGDMDPAFLDLPPEVIRTSMRVHQRYFAVRDPATGKLAPHFVSIANIEAIDGGATIARGNAKVLSARLADARFFWEEDKKVRLEDRLEALRGVTFHAKLGTLRQRADRLREMAIFLSPFVAADADAELAGAAGLLCKTDLVSGMVREFPELQGVMGRYYYRAENGLPTVTPNFEGPLVEGVLDPEDSSRAIVIADAIGQHYRPQSASDTVPSGPISVAVALADKIDALVGFFAIDERPTGSRDPFALRRAAIGVIRTILAAGIRLPMGSALRQAHEFYLARFREAEALRFRSVTGSFRKYDEENILMKEPAETDAFYYVNVGVLKIDRVHAWLDSQAQDQFDESKHARFLPGPEVVSSLLAFFADRLKVQLREDGQRHDLVDAIFALGDDDLVRIVARVQALGVFLGTEDGANLLAGYKRAVNILKAEEKKGPLPAGPAVIYEKMHGAEFALLNHLNSLELDLAKALDEERFADAMRLLAGLRAPVDAFFDKVLVNSDVPEERDNRLRLLIQVRDAMGRVADFSQVTG